MAVQEKIGKEYNVSVMAGSDINEYGYYFSIYQNENDLYKNNKIVNNKMKLFRFINEFDLFGYNKAKRESIPCPDIVDAKPFTFELEII